MEDPRQTIERGKTALVAVSRRGSELALRLRSDLPEVNAFLPERFSPAGDAGVHAWQGVVRGLMPRLFAEYRSLVLFGSVGMAVRLLAPLLTDKHTDPAVVVVDDAGRFAVSLLSGHLGGANDLARRVAGLLGATPVITTASDLLGLPAVDLLGREIGWRLEGEENVTRVSAAVVNGEPVGLLQEAGEPDWWPAGEPLPSHLIPFTSREELAASSCAAALVITDRSVSGWEERWPPAVVYRPRSLVVGIGCHRGALADEIAQVVEAALESGGLARASVRAVATVDLKSEEEGLRQFAERLGVPLRCYAPEELSRVAPNPSEVVRRHVGATGVCEPAALLASGARSLLVPKFKASGVTVAVARVEGHRPIETASCHCQTCEGRSPGVGETRRWEWNAASST